MRPSKSLYDFDQSLLNDFDQSVYTCTINTRRYNVLFNIIGGFERKMKTRFAKIHKNKTKQFVTV